MTTATGGRCMIGGSGANLVAMPELSESESVAHDRLYKAATVAAALLLLAGAAAA